MFQKNSFMSKTFIIVMLLPILAISADKLGWYQEMSVLGEEQKDLEVGDAKAVPLQGRGECEDRLKLVLLGDGDTADDMDKCHEDVDRKQNIQWTEEPFRSYPNYFKVYVVETPSVDSGISCDSDDGNVRRDTV